MNPILKKVAWAGLFASWAFGVAGQTNIQINEGGTVTTCDGFFVDDGDIGDPAGGPYSNNDYVITICPDNPGDAIAAEFLSFQLQTNANPNNNDMLFIYDGDSNGAPLIGVGTGNNFQDVTATASLNNPTGCLTFQFVVNNGATAGAIGWAAQVTCVTPCTVPTSSLELLDPDAFEDNPNSVGICPMQDVTFDGSNSEGDGAPLANWIWNWGDGNVETTSTMSAMHAYDTPGEYLVTLVVEDENGCSSTNLEPFQVLVSTIPIFNAEFTTPLCTGSPGSLDGNPVQSVTWTALPPVSVSEEQALPDNSNVPFESDMVIDFFDEGQVVEECDDIMSLSAVMEHTFIGDLTIWVECPNGQEMLLLDNGPSGGADATGCMFPDLGGNNLGDPVAGIGWEYTWDMDADFIMDDPSNPAVDGGAAVPAGSYLPCGDFCDLLGCPLNGVWTLNIHDQWLGDDGFLFNWTLDFNPEIVPGVTAFTPTIGLDADSSYWDLDLDTYGVTELDGEADYVGLEFDVPGDYEFDYVVTNNFGCTWDTTVVVNVVPGLDNSVTAGPDVVFCQDAVQLQGAFTGSEPSACGGVEGTFEYCYGNNIYEEFYFCPDNPGDGTMITLSIEQGGVENAIFDQLYIYDGPDVDSPILAGPLSGPDLSGNVFTATNPDGCLTVSIDTDGSVSCSSGSYDPLIFCTSCGSSQSSCGYTWTWDPPLYLDDPNIQNPMVTDFDGEPFTYTLLVEPIDLPNCGTTDEVQVLPGFEFTYEVTQVSCYGNDGEVEVDIASSPADGPWNIVLSEGGTLVESTSSGGGLTVIGDLVPGDYLLEVSDDGGCLYAFDIELLEPEPLLFDLTPDQTICIDGAVTLEASSDMDPSGTWTYHWDNGLGTGDAHTVSPVVTTDYTVYATTPNGCPSDEQTVTVNVLDSLSVQLGGDDLICGGAFASLSILDADGGSGSGYTYTWEWQGMNLATGSETEFMDAPPSTGTYCVTLTDDCETPAVESCHEVVIETPIPANFHPDTTHTCIPGVIQFTSDVDQTLIQDQFWTFGDGEAAFEANPVHVYPQPGSYTVSYHITSVLGCDYSLTEPGLIDVFDVPSVGYAASPQPTSVPDTEIDFESVNSAGVVEWEWNFGSLGEYGVSNEVDPTFQFPIDRGGLYPVTLVVTDVNGCSAQVTRTIEVFDLFNLYIPTSFTPNNDGVNDAFYVQGTDIDPDRFLLQVFNRWNNKVFETRDMNEVWHGPAVNDSEYYAQNGLYFYRVVVYNKSQSAERHEYTGTVTIIR